MRVLWASGIALVLAGCVAQPPEPPMTEVPVEPPEVCAGVGLTDLIGKSAKVLETMRFGAEVRILRPGDAMTKDYNPARTNIMIDEKNIIFMINCG